MKQKKFALVELLVAIVIFAVIVIVVTIIVSKPIPKAKKLGVQAQQIKEKAAEDELASIDPDNNLRYVGANPNNYVSFNNELYRIIGVFNNQMKIIYWGPTSNPGQFYKNTTIVWDTNKVNNWENASLKKELNETYWNGVSSTYKTMVDENHAWQLGGTTSSITRSAMYNYERGTTVSSGNPTTWTGAVGLMYASDFAYASSGKDSICGSTNLIGWDGSSVVSECTDKSWLYNTSESQWTLTLSILHSNYVFVVCNGGYVYDDFVDFDYGVRPVLYLKSNVKIKNGSGTSSEPFEIGV